MYSQNNEEKFITDFFEGQIGRFLDIGAYDGVTFSNVFQLVKNAWSGVCIEPSPTVFDTLKKNYKEYPDIELLKYAISEETGEKIFYDSNGDAISSFSKKHKEKWEKGYKCTFNEIKVNTLSVEDLFKRVGFNFDFINLDVEATNLFIFKRLPFKEFKNVQMICVEHDSNIKEMKQIVKEFGFKEIHRNAENLILCR